jgi:hypothetical protein
VRFSGFCGEHSTLGTNLVKLLQKIHILMAVLHIPVTHRGRGAATPGEGDNDNRMIDTRHVEKHSGAAPYLKKPILVSFSVRQKVRRASSWMSYSGWY